MISFSLQRNRLWGGTGFLIKNSSLELSSLCFANQDVTLTPGKYKIKIIGSPISGNGIFSLLILNSENEIFSKKILFSGKNNTETSFDFDLNISGKFTVKIQRNKDSIGRILISLLNITKEIDIIKPNIRIQSTKDLILKEKTFVIINYDILNDFNFFNLFTSINNRSNFFFLVKTNQNYLSKDKSLNFKMFFEWDDLFDYISLYESKSILYLEDNIEKTLFTKYNLKLTDISEVKNNNKSTKNISGILF